MRSKIWLAPAILLLTAAPSFTACGDFEVSLNLLALPGNVTVQADVTCLSSSSVLRVFNWAGEQVRSLPFPQTLPAPPAMVPVSWDGKNQSGDDCASGVYILHLTGSPNAGIRRIALVR